MTARINPRSMRPTCSRLLSLFDDAQGQHAPRRGASLSDEHRAGVPVGQWLAAALAIDLAKHNVEAAKDGRHVGQHVAPVHEVHGLQVWETRSANLAAIGSVAAIGHQVNAK